MMLADFIGRQLLVCVHILHCVAMHWAASAHQVVDGVGTELSDAVGQIQWVSGSSHKRVLDRLVTPRSLHAGRCCHSIYIEKQSAK